MHHEINCFRVSLLVTAVLMVVYLAALRQDDSPTPRSRRDARSAGYVAPIGTGLFRARRSQPAGGPADDGDGSAKPQVQRPFQLGSAQLPTCPAVISTVEFNKRNGHWFPLHTNLYSKVAGDPRGLGGGWLSKPGDLPVVASDRVSDAAVQEACIVVNHKILPKLRRDVLKELHAARTRFVILADGEELRGTQSDAQLHPGIVATAEADVLCSDDGPERGESSLIGQLGNEIGRALEKDTSFSSKLADLWESARRRRIYSDNDQITSPRSYWAESVKTYFDANLDAFRVHDRKTLHAQDPEMETLLTTVFLDEGYRYRCPRLDADGNLLGCRQPLQQQQRRRQQQAAAPAASAWTSGRQSQPDQPQSALRFRVEEEQKVMEPPAAPGLGLRRRLAEENGSAPVEPHCKLNEIHCVRHDGHIYLLCGSDGLFRSHSAPPGTRCRETEGVVDFVPTATVRSEYSPAQPFA